MFLKLKFIFLYKISHKTNESPNVPTKEKIDESIKTGTNAKTPICLIKRQKMKKYI